MKTPMSPSELEVALHAIGAERYHNLHPFHDLLHGGKLNKGQVQAWALNRFAYQAIIPRKDAAMLANLPDREMRREWRQRMFDHDGIDGDEGGIERWLVLTSALGLERDYVVGLEGILPTTRLATEAYLHFVQNQPVLDGIASSLTELFAPKIHRDRIAGMLEHYDFIDEDMVGYFRTRLNQAPRDVDFALKYVRKHATTLESQGRVLSALKFKTDVLWAQLDALYLAYVEPGLIAPGAFVPDA